MSKIGNLKILVVGDVNGKFASTFSKISNLNKKNGPFEVVFCVGNFFGDDIDEWKDMEKCIIQVPVPTYILGPIFSETAKFYKDRDGEDMVPNLAYLGKRGIFTFSSGLKVAYLSGVESSDPDSVSETSFTQKDVEEVVTLAGGNACGGVDILLTSQWPAGVEKYGKETEVEPSGKTSPLIAQLALRLKPRYHFAGLADVFYERLPYRNYQILAEISTHASRFIGLGSMNTARKQRFLYAFNLVPMSKISLQELRRQPDGTTTCPYEKTAALSKSDKMEDIVAKQYFYDVVSGPPKHEKRKGDFQNRGRKRERQEEGQEPASCWFCLSSPEVEKHLVVSVGLQTYVALAKGGLTPDHVLILPIVHIRSAPELDDDGAAELERYKQAVIRFFAAQNKSVVFFERNFKSKHMQLQVVPIPKRDASLVKELFLQRAEECQLKLTEIPSRSDVRQIIKPGNTFFYVELDNGEKMFYKIDQKGFPLQFGRDVCASRQLLNMPDRIDWRECQATKEQEQKMATDFKEKFQPYDFNFEE